VILALIALFLAGLAAGVMNALAGGGSFLTFPSLLFAGLDPRAANITSTIALFPGQVTTGLAVRRLVAGTGRLSFRALLGISLVGGFVGALLLLATPPDFFARLVPWLVLFATAIFAWGSFLHRPGTPVGGRIGPVGSAFIQALVSVYGGYFGGGIGFLMLAALTLAGMKVRQAGGTKNVLAGVINASAVVVFLFSREVAWLQAAVLAVAAILGGQLGAFLLYRVNEKWLRAGVVVIGALLTIGLFLRD
jgi:uncharacterized membrane protein YfcA